jgi:outer membrane biosynthesis protein TonB
MIDKLLQIINRLERHPGMSASVLMHLTLFIFLLISFPQCQRKNPPEIIISVDLLPIAKKTNIENKQASQEKPKENKPADNKPKPVKKMQEEVKKEEPEPILEKKKEEVVEKKPEVKKEPKPKPKEKPVPDKKQPKKKTKPKESELDTLFKNLMEEEKKNDNKEKVEKTSKGPMDPGAQLSMSVKDSIKRQIEQCWNPPAGNKDAAKLQVLLDISLKQDGTVANVRIIDNSRYTGDDLYQVAADAAVRAVYKCSPLQDLPVDQYDVWRNLEFNFDPSDLIY